MNIRLATWELNAIARMDSARLSWLNDQMKVEEPEGPKMTTVLFDAMFDAS